MAEKMAEMFPPGVLEKALTEKTIDRYRLDTPAFCSKCGKSYYRKDALQRHIKECGRIPPLACPICPYRTFRKVSLSFKQFPVDLNIIIITKARKILLRPLSKFNLLW